jgi:hypothetical protein
MGWGRLFLVLPQGQPGMPLPFRNNKGYTANRFQSIIRFFPVILGIYFSSWEGCQRASQAAHRGRRLFRILDGLKCDGRSSKRFREERFNWPVFADEGAGRRSACIQPWQSVLSTAMLELGQESADGRTLGAYGHKRDKTSVGWMKNPAALRRIG